MRQGVCHCCFGWIWSIFDQQYYKRNKIKMCIVYITSDVFTFILEIAFYFVALFHIILNCVRGCVVRKYLLNCVTYDDLSSMMKHRQNAGRQPAYLLDLKRIVLANRQQELL